MTVMVEMINEVYYRTKNQDLDDVLEKVLCEEYVEAVETDEGTRTLLPTRRIVAVLDRAD